MAELQDIMTVASLAETSPDSPPEGGKLAWRTVTGCSFILFSTFGLQTSVGLLQIHLSTTELLQYTPFQVSWIPSVFIFLTLAASIQAGALFDRYGPRYLLLLGSTFYIITFFIAAHCHAYWSFMIVFGVVGGLSSAILITVAQSVIAHWFDKRRGFAGGIAMLGSAFGGIVFPLILRYALPKSGWPTSMYILGSMVAVCLIAGNCLVKGRLQASRTDSLISFKCFVDSKFLWTTLATFGYELFTIAGWGLIPTIVLKGGFGDKHSFYSVIVMSIGSIFGRTIPPWLADRYGRFNVLVVVTAVTITFLPLLLVATEKLAVMYLFCFLFGLSSGTFVCLSATCVGQICDSSVYGQWMGASDSVVSFATLISIPVGIALEGAGSKQQGVYNIHGYLTGILAMSLVACLIARWGCLGWDRSKLLPRPSDVV